jgi:hypothetical protein
MAQLSRSTRHVDVVGLGSFLFDRLLFCWVLLNLALSLVGRMQDDLTSMHLEQKVLVYTIPWSRQGLCQGLHQGLVLCVRAQERQLSQDPPFLSSF